MRIGMQTWGSDGDILPYVSLARGLVAAGHQCSLVITSGDDKDYSSLGDGKSVEIIQTSSPMGNDPALLDYTGQVIITKRDPFRQLEITLETVSALCLANMSRASLDLCRKCDLVIAHNLSYSLNWMAERVGVPCINVSLCPLALRSANPGESDPPFSWWQLPSGVQHKYERQIEELWRREGLGSTRHAGTWKRNSALHLIGASRVFYQLQQDDTVPGHVCGFFSVPEESRQWQFAPELKAFLEVGPPPVYVTFGSLMARSAALRAGIIQTLREAVTMADCRAIIQVPAGDAARLRSDRSILFSPPTPHQQVFPYCQAVVHHGGAGTTHAATRAGCPSVVVPHAYDQFFWGRLLAQVHVAPSPLPLLDVTAPALAERISLVKNSPQMKQQAQRLGETLRAEDGVAEAVRAIHAWGGA